MKIDYKKIKETKWYQQGGAVRPIYISYPLQALNSFYLKNKPIKYFYKNFMMEFKDGQLRDYIDVENAAKIVNFYVNKQKQNKQFIQNAKKYWGENNVKPYLKLVKKLTSTNFNELTSRELLQIFNKFSEIFLMVWRNAIFHDAFDVKGDELIDKLLVKYKIKLKPTEKGLLLSNYEVTILQQWRLELLKLIDLVLKNNNLKQAIIDKDNIKQKFPNFYKKVTKYSKKYHWLHNDFASIEYLDEKYFLKIIRDIIVNKKKLAEEKNFKNHFKKIEIARNKLIKSKKIPSKVLNIVNLILIIALWRDERKAYNQIAGSILNKFLKEATKHNGITKDLLEYLFLHEIKNIFKLRKQDIQRLKKRKSEGVFYINTGLNKMGLVQGSQVKKIRKILNQQVKQKNKLQGSPAWHGKITARVKIILSKQDFHKLKPGEILVAPNTRPEYMPIIKIAGAMISEEGGITCHTAIVARELKIPAIVGAQGVIKVFKDGDLVEVDADKGIVIKLK